jgi:hypothetical protein
VNYLISLAVEAMCVGRVNITNRRFQARLVNFKSYRVDLELTVQHLGAMRDANAVTKWLTYRVNHKDTKLHKYFKLEDKDKQLCKARTATFVQALILALKNRMPNAQVLEAFDVFEKARIQAALRRGQIDRYDEADLRTLFELFLHVCFFFFFFFFLFLFFFFF